MQTCATCKHEHNHASATRCRVCGGTVFVGDRTNDPERYEVVVDEGGEG